MTTIFFPELEYMYCILIILFLKETSNRYYHVLKTHVRGPRFVLMPLCNLELYSICDWVSGLPNINYCLNPSKWDVLITYLALNCVPTKRQLMFLESSVKTLWNSHIYCCTNAIIATLSSLYFPVSPTLFPLYEKYLSKKPNQTFRP